MPDYGNQFDADGLQYIWNSHSLSAWLKCPRYYQYTILDGFRGRNVHFDFGGWYAGSLQTFYTTLAGGAPREDAIREAVRYALTESWEHDRDGVTGEKIPGTGQPWDSQHNAKDRGTLIRSLVWYFEEFKIDLPVHTIEGKPAVELHVQADIDDGLVLAGHLDRVVLYDGQPWVMDQKTTSSAITPAYFEQWKPNTQMTTYTYLGNIVFPDSVKGVVIDAAQVIVGSTRFARGTTHRTKSELEEWYDGALGAFHAARTATRERRFPQNPESCHNYGGCAFRQVCSRSPEVRKNFLAAAFHQPEKN
jgi:hypothetical protein